MSNIIQANTKLATADFTKLGTGTVADDVVGSVYMLDATLAGAFKYTILYKAAPTPPYSFTAHFINYGTTAQYQECGICLLDSVSGKFVSFVTVSNSAIDASVNVTRQMTNTTNFAGNYTSVGNAHYCQWFGYVDNNTNRYSYLSRDGINWLLYDQQARTDFVTPNKIGICIDPYSQACYCHFDHFKVDYSG